MKTKGRRKSKNVTDLREGASGITKIIHAVQSDAKSKSLFTDNDKPAAPKMGAKFVKGMDKRIKQSAAKDAKPRPRPSAKPKPRPGVLKNRKKS